MKLNDADKGFLIAAVWFVVGWGVVAGALLFATWGVR